MRVAMGTMHELRAASSSFRAVTGEVEKRHSIRLSHIGVRGVLSRKR